MEMEAAHAGLLGQRVQVGRLLRLEARGRPARRRRRAGAQGRRLGSWVGLLGRAIARWRNGANARPPRSAYCGRLAAGAQRSRKRRSSPPATGVARTLAPGRARPGFPPCTCAGSVPGGRARSPGRIRGGTGSRTRSGRRGTSGADPGRTGPARPRPAAVAARSAHVASGPGSWRAGRPAAGRRPPAAAAPRSGCPARCRWGCSRPCRPAHGPAAGGRNRRRTWAVRRRRPQGCRGR